MLLAAERCGDTRDRRPPTTTIASSRKCAKLDAADEAGRAAAAAAYAPRCVRVCARRRGAHQAPTVSLPRTPNHTPHGRATHSARRRDAWIHRRPHLRAPSGALAATVRNASARCSCECEKPEYAERGPVAVAAGRPLTCVAASALSCPLDGKRMNRYFDTGGFGALPDGTRLTHLWRCLGKKGRKKKGEKEKKEKRRMHTSGGVSGGGRKKKKEGKKKETKQSG